VKTTEGGEGNAFIWRETRFEEQNFSNHPSTITKLGNGPTVPHLEKAFHAAGRTCVINYSRYLFHLPH
jgi:hypothetical protein